MISFACPTCRRPFVVPPQAAGQRGRCPGCGAEVTAPHDAKAPTAIGSGVQQSLLLSASAAELARPGAPGASRLGRYVLQAELGRGGMGVVYRATDEHLRRAVAIKTLLTGEGVDAGAVERFRREAEAAARLRHPGIVAVHEVGAGPDGAPFMVMDLVVGQSLAKRLAAEDKLPLEDAVRVVRDVVRAIEHAHEQGVLHRDLKPQNVMLDASGRALVMDFGLAKLQGATQLTREGSMLGTPAYMPPEQVDGIDVDARSDVYSLGATLYHAITGKPPFEAQSQAALLTAVLTKEPVPPSQLNRRAQGDLETICLRALEKEPARRYASASALADDLDRWLEGEPVSARPLGRLGRLARRARRNKLVTGALVTGALALVAGGGVAARQTLVLRAEQEAAESRERERLEAEAAREKAHAATLQGALDEARAEKARADRTLARVIYERGLGALVEGRAREAAIYAATALSEATRVGAPSRDLTSYRAAWAIATQGSWRRAQELVRLPHVGTVELAISPDGRRAAFVGEQDALLWSADTGETRSFAHPGQDWRRELVFAPDGRVLLAAHAGLLAVDTTGAVTQALAVAYGHRGLPITPDGKTMAVSLAGGVGLIDLATWKVRRVQPPEGRSFAGSACMAWAGDTELLIAEDEGIVALETDSGVLHAPFGDPSTCALAVSPKGHVIASGTADGWLRVWKRVPGERPVLRAATAAHPTAVRSIAVSPDGGLVATRGQEGHVRVWNFHCALTAAFSFRSPPEDVGFLADGRLVVTTADGCAQALDVSTSVLNGHTDTVRALSFSPDSTALVSASHDARVITWDAVAGPREPRARLLTNVETSAYAVTMEAAGRFVVGLASGSVQRIDADRRSSVELGTHGRDGEVLAMAAAGPGRVVTGGSDLRSWELGATDQRPLWTAPHPRTVLGVAVDARRGRAATACRDGLVRLWDLETGAPGVVLEGQLPAAVAVELLPDGRVVAGGADGTLRLWEASGRQVESVRAHDGIVCAIDLRAGDAPLLATGGIDGLVKLWSFDPRLEVVAELRRHRGPVHAVAFSPDGRWLASGGEDRGVRWWPLAEIFGGPTPAEILREAQDGTGLEIRVDEGEVDPTERP